MHDYRSILVGIDFHPWSAGALRAAVRIGRAFGAPIRVVHVVDTGIIVALQDVLGDVQRAEQHTLGLNALFAHLPHADAARTPDLRACLVEEAERAWDRLTRQIPEASGLRIEVPIGNRKSELIDAVRRNQVDLLVLGAYGTRPADFGFGTVATMCVRRAPSDVLLVRGSQPHQFRRVMAAIDFSDNSAFALRRAAALAGIDNAELHAVHIVEPPTQGLHGFALKPSVVEQYRQTLDGRLTQFVQAHLGATAVAVKCSLSDESHERDGIVARAHQLAADLIVIGKRGCGGLQEFLIGSTAERTLKHSNVSVLAVKPPVASAEPRTRP